MSSGINRVTLVGNLGKDPEVKFLQGGNAVCNLRLAVTERRKFGDDWRDETEWFDVVCFGKTAENAGQYLAKGRQIYVEGRGQTRKWKDKDEKDRYSFEVVANQILFLGSNPDKDAPAKTQAKDQTPNGSDAVGDGAEPLPF